LMSVRQQIEPFESVGGTLIDDQAISMVFETRYGPAARQESKQVICYADAGGWTQMHADAAERVSGGSPRA